MDAKPIIKIEKVHKIYKMGHVKVHALRGLNMEIYKRDFVILMGPSGSGKSTAMAIVGCLDLPTKGHVYLEGTDISHLGESELAQIRGKKIGFVILNNTGIGRYRNLAIGKSIQRIDGFIGRHSGSQMYQNLYIFCCIVVDLFDFYFSLLVGFDN